MGLLKLVIKIIEYKLRFGFRGMFFLLKRTIRKNGIVKFLHPEFCSKPIFLRNNTTDITMFHQVIYNLDYNFDYGFEPKVVLDCGANIGLASVYFKNKFPASKVISIEPEQSNFDLLVRNTQEYDNVFCLKYGLWNATCHLNIEDKGLGNCGFIVSETDACGPHTIKAITISEIMQQYNLDLIDILKIDIEGSEKELFESGYENWLPKTRVIIIELHDNLKLGAAESFFKALSNYNYTLTISGENVIVFMNQT